MNTIKHMVSRFLGWNLPKDFSPDAGINFHPSGAQKSGMSNETDNFPDHCPNCDGTGEGLFDQLHCTSCKGKGFLPSTLMDDDFDIPDEPECPDNYQGDY